MKEVYLSYRADNAETADLAGRLLGPDSYDILVDEDCDVYKPDGSVLLKYRKGVIPLAVCLQAVPVLRKATRPTKNRGVAAGIPDVSDGKTVRAGKVKFRRVLEDGSLSNTLEANTVLSGTVGAFDRNVRFPYCRLTTFTVENWADLQRAYPLVKAASDCFARELPDRYAAQWAHVEKTHKDYRILDSVFTTFSVNKNWQTAVHQDAGDLKQGFGVMTALRSGQFEGCYTCFPQYRVAVSMRTGCVCLADVHEWHGNTPFEKTREGFERLSVVMYYRENMDRCGSTAEEQEHAKRRQGGPLWADKER